MPDHHAHGHGMAEDLPRLEAMLARRRALKWFAGAGTTALVAGCGGADGSGSATPIAIVTTSASGCVADPTETGGPYPADGTNGSNGSTSNVLRAGGLVRSDIRSSFISSTTVATGVPVTLTLTLANANASCAPLAGYAVYLWHCDRLGGYSLYHGAADSYLRGVQVTDARRQVTFTTIFPACYDDRWPHMHFEVFSSLTNALGGRYAVLTSRFCMPTALCNTLYADTATYPTSASIFKGVSLPTDTVFGDNTAAQIAQETPAFTGSVAAGYTATALIGIAR